MSLRDEREEIAEENQLAKRHTDMQRLRAERDAQWEADRIEWMQQEDAGSSEAVEGLWYGPSGIFRQMADSPYATQTWDGHDARRLHPDRIVDGLEIPLVDTDVPHIGAKS